MTPRLVGSQCPPFYSGDVCFSFTVVNAFRRHPNIMASTSGCKDFSTIFLRVAVLQRFFYGLQYCKDFSTGCSTAHLRSILVTTAAWLWCKPQRSLPLLVVIILIGDISCSLATNTCAMLKRKFIQVFMAHCYYYSTE